MTTPATDPRKGRSLGAVAGTLLGDFVYMMTAVVGLAAVMTLTLIVMMAHVSLISLAYRSLLVVLGNVVARRLAALRSAGAIATRLAGIALVGFAIKLAIDNR